MAALTQDSGPWQVHKSVAGKSRSAGHDRAQTISPLIRAFSKYANLRTFTRALSKLRERSAWLLAGSPNSRSFALTCASPVGTAILGKRLSEYIEGTNGVIGHRTLVVIVFAQRLELHPHAVACGMRSTGWLNALVRIPRSKEVVSFALLGRCHRQRS